MAEQRDRREIGNRIVAERPEQEAVHREPGRADVQGVAVGLGACDHFGGDVGAGAGLFSTTTCWPQMSDSRRADHARDRVDSAARRERHDQPHEAVRPGLPDCANAGARQVGAGRARASAGRLAQAR